MGVSSKHLDIGHRSTQQCWPSCCSLLSLGAASAARLHSPENSSRVKKSVMIPDGIHALRAVGSRHGIRIEYAVNLTHSAWSGNTMNGCIPNDMFYQGYNTICDGDSMWEEGTTRGCLQRHCTRGGGNNDKGTCCDNFKGEAYGELCQCPHDR